MKICSIHQPNFIPWLPYFDKIAKSDVFIFLDEVSYPKSGNSMGSWCNRVNICMNNNDLWFSCPVVREHGAQIIKSVKINYKKINFDKWLLTLRCAYGRYANFEIILKIIEEVLNEKHIFLADFNISFIKKICNLLNRKSIFFRQSDLKSCALSSNELLVDLCKQVGASHYLSGVGALDYMDSKKFSESQVEIVYQSTNYANYIDQIKKYSILHFLITTEQRKWKKFNAEN